MKKIILLIALLISTISFAQTAKGFNYKAIVTNNGNPVANANISVKVTIKNASSTIWAETHSGVHTDANGIFVISIGEGTRNGGVSSFDKVDWSLPTVNYSVSVNTGSGYTNLVTNKYFKLVPYAKQAERLLPASYNVVIKNSSTNSYGFRVDGGNSYYAGYRINHNADDWYIYMKTNKSWAVSNDGVDVLTISDTDNSVWVRGKLKATTSGNADMKAYIYGRVNSTGTIVTNASSGGFTCTRVSTGEYKITFTDSPGNADNYIVVATANGSYNNVGINQSSNYFNLFVRNTSSGNYANTSVSFVVYKK